jgi:hypothetical protein
VQREGGPIEEIHPGGVIWLPDRYRAQLRRVANASSVLKDQPPTEIRRSMTAVIEE